jgi:hypothetical protein
MVTLKIEDLDGLAWGGIALAAVTGVLHLFLGVSGLAGTVIGTGLAVAFLLAGLGFFGAIALVVLDVRRRQVYALGVPYTAVQVLLWYVLNFDSVGDMLANAGPIGYVDKIAQVLLLLVLVALYRRGD